MSASFRRLVQSGLLNQTVGSLSDYVDPKRVMYLGICSGWRTMNFRKKLRGPNQFKQKVVACRFKTDKRSVDVCPNCGYYLLWTRAVVDVNGKRIETKKERV